MNKCWQFWMCVAVRCLCFVVAVASAGMRKFDIATFAMAAACYLFINQKEWE